MTSKKKVHEAKKNKIIKWKRRVESETNTHTYKRTKKKSWKKRCSVIFACASAWSPATTSPRAQRHPSILCIVAFIYIYTFLFFVFALSLSFHPVEVPFIFMYFLFSFFNFFFFAPRQPSTLDNKDSRELCALGVALLCHTDAAAAAE